MNQRKDIKEVLAIHAEMTEDYCKSIPFKAMVIAEFVFAAVLVFLVLFLIGLSGPDVVAPGPGSYPNMWPR
jgi:hypothetical protein